MQNFSLKSKRGKLICALLIVYYLADLYFAKVFSSIFIIGLLRGVRFDWVSMGGLFSILHLIFILVVLPSMLFFYKPDIWSRKRILLYIASAILFYSAPVYGLFQGRYFNPWQFASLTIIMLFISLSAFFYILKIRKTSANIVT